MTVKLVFSDGGGGLLWKYPFDQKICEGYFNQMAMREFADYYMKARLVRLKLTSKVLFSFCFHENIEDIV